MEYYGPEKEPDRQRYEALEKEWIEKYPDAAFSETVFAMQAFAKLCGSLRVPKQDTV